MWSCQNVCDALSYLLDSIYIRFGTTLNKQIVGILMGTNCAPLVAYLFLFCYERVIMRSERVTERYCITFCEKTVTLHLNFRRMLCSHEEVSFNNVFLNMLKGTLQIYLVKRFSKILIKHNLKAIM